MTTWSGYQSAVFDAIASGTGHVIVRARAGSGKTTTVIEALNRIPAGSRVLLCAFNASIARELESRAPRHVTVRTLHGLGFAAVKGQWPKVQIDKRRGRRLLERALNRRPSTDLVTLLSLCKARMQTDPATITREVKSAGGVVGMPDDRVAAAILTAMDAACVHDGTIDFDDQVFVPVALGLRVGSFDVVLVDETQDMNAAQLQLAQAALAPGGRLVVVGDDRQAIYGWRGADVGFMARMETELHATVLPLSVTYRCPRRIVDLARVIVPDLESPPDAIEGSIETRKIDAAGWREGDAVLSRINAPLVRHAMAALRAGLRARIQGKDLAAGIRGWIDSFHATTSADLIRRARVWAEGERTRLAGDEENEEQLAQVADKVETLEALAEGATTVQAVTGRLDLLFADDGPGLVFSSVHRAKGLEWNRVFLLSWTFKPERSEEEENLWYVAVTRSKRDLVLLTDYSSETKSPTVRAAIRSAQQPDVASDARGAA